jgi:putative hydrolase of the HAD superfamily
MPQLSNIVFDMGGVLMDWDPVKISLALCPDPDDAALLRKAVFDSREWGWVDAGAIAPETVAWTAQLKLPERLHELAETFALRWHVAFDPLPAMGELVRELKADGYGVYLLSNAGPTFEEYRDRIPAIDAFDGILVSCYEHVVKPDEAIYQLFCERYGLEPASCLFVDDLRRNVVGAQRAGMQGYRYDGDVEALRAFIRAQEVAS